MSTRSTPSKTMNKLDVPEKAVDRVLAYMPPEIFHEITDWIDSPGDLRAFTLTCRLFAAIASPRHTQLRSLRCPVMALCVWEALAADVALARNVRHLDIQDSPCPGGGWHLPALLCKASPDCWHCSRHDSANNRKMWERVEKPMVAALTNMSSLLSLKWKSHLYKFPLDPKNDRDDIWTALRSCSSMTALSVKEGDFGEIFHCTNIFSLSNLTFFEYETETFGFEGLPSDGKALGVMLRDRCPKLQTLKLRFPNSILEGYPPPLFGTSVLSGRWPDLEHVQLECVACHPEEASSFLAAHPNIRFLEVDEFFSCRQFAGMEIYDLTDKDLVELPLTLPPAVLPKLCTLRCAPGHAADILAAMKMPGIGTPRPHLTVTLTNFHPWHPRMRGLCMVGILTDTETITFNANDYVRGLIASAGSSANEGTEL
ncbi:hypothetical protein FA95DRAFT_1574763 [Auriscalpium vulgare]|uniref:Uncharacterized protein n=1 Tax=Auriscalpium vulgare TaxID=40419 RepID=A0ACB8RJA5_9AGAM|nr:hypothetical protein FA95DRAFT_1574763 [Auriscalpium vulgare]